MAIIGILNDCLYCHKEYKPNLANHYCDDCVMVCVQCDTLKGTFAFNFDYESEAYKNWKATGCHGVLEKAGHLTTCGACLRKEDDGIEKLKKMVQKMKPGQLELMLEAAKGKK